MNNPSSLNLKNSANFLKVGRSTTNLNLGQIESRFAELNLASSDARIKLSNLLLFISVYLQKIDSNSSMSNANRFPSLSREQLLNALLGLKVGLTNNSASELLSFCENATKVDGDYSFANIHGGLTQYLTNRNSLNFTAELPTLLSLEDFTNYSYQDKISHSGIYTQIDQLIAYTEAGIITNQSNPSNNSAYASSRYANHSRYANIGNDGESKNPSKGEYDNERESLQLGKGSLKSNYENAENIEKIAAPAANQMPAPVNLSELKIVVEDATNSNSTYQICEHLTAEQAKLVEQEYGVVLKKDPNNPQQFNGFLGGGAFGKVYVAKNLNPNSSTPQYCAIKIVQGDQKAVAESKHESALQFELTKAIAQNESQLMPLIGIGKEAGNQVIDTSKLYMAMPLAGMGSGEDLRKLLKDLNIGGDFARLLMAYVGKSVLLGLYQMHSNNTYHLDLKPGNLMIDQSGQVKLSDFGTSEKIDGNPPSLTTHLDSNTGRFVGNGDIAYFPPEREHRNCTFNSAKADSFAAGASLWEFLTGSEFPGVEQALRLPQLKNSNPGSLADLVKSLLSLDKNRRPSLEQALNHPSLCIAELHDTSVIQTVLDFLKRFVKYSQLKARGDAAAEASFVSLRQSMQTVTDDAFALNPLLRTPFVNNSEVTTQLATYQPLKGSKVKQVTDPQTQTFDLEQKVIEFLASPDKIALTIFAEGGSGKSLFVQHLTQELLVSTFAIAPSPRNKYLGDNGKPYLPLYISLSSVKHPDRLLEEGVGLTKEAVKKLTQTYQLVIIGDGYDEQQSFTNLYIQNQLNQYDAKLVITCRPNALPGSYSEYFIPRVVGENISRGFEEFYVQNFQASQIEAYVDGYASRTYVTKAEQDAQAIAIKEQLRGIPGLLEIMQNPLLCRLVLFALPELLKSTYTNSPTRLITRAQVYAAFMQRWIELQLAKHTQANLPDLPQVLQYGQTLVFGLYTTERARQLDIGETKYNFDPSTHRYQKQAKSIFEQLGVSESQFDTIKSILPLQESQKGVWKFTHLSMQEYLLALHLYTKLMQVLNSDNSDLIPSDWNRINLSLEVLDRPVLYFLGNMAKINSEFTQRLFKLVFQTRTNKTQSQTASNAMTVLVASGLSLAGMDFSNIEIPNADLSGGNFWGCNFTKANLTNSNLKGANLGEADLTEANLDKVSFGQFPAVKTEKAIMYSSYSGALNCVVGCCDFSVYLYSVPQMKLIKEFKQKQLAYQASIDPSGKYLAVATGDKKIPLWDIATGQLIHEFEGHKDGVTSIGFAPSGKYFASGSGESHEVILWDVESQSSHTLGDHKKFVANVVFDSSSNYLASVDPDGEILLWDIIQNKLIQNVTTDYGGVNSLAFDFQGKYLASCGANGVIYLWDRANNCSRARTLIGHTAQVSGLLFNPQSHNLISSSYDGSVLVWDTETGNILQRFTHHQGKVDSCLVDKSGRYLISGCLEDKSLRMIDLEMPTPLLDRSYHRGEITNCGFIQGGNQIISSSRDKSLKICSSTTGDMVKSTNQAEAVLGYALDPQERYLAVILSTEVIIYNSQLDTKLASLAINAKVALFSPDGNYLVTGGTKGQIHLWNSHTWQQVSIPTKHTHEIHTLAFSSNSQYLASGGWDNIICIHDIKQSKLISSLRSHTSINSLVFNPQSGYLISGSNDGRINFWDINQARLITKLDNLVYGVNDLSLSPNNQYLAVAGMDKCLRVYDLSTNGLICTREFKYSVLKVSFNSDKAKNLQLIVASGSDLSYWQVKFNHNSKIDLLALWCNESPRLDLQAANISNVQGINETDWDLIKELKAYGQIPKNLADKLGYSQVTRALLSNQANLVRQVLQSILNDITLDPQAKFTQLLAENGDGIPGFHLTLREGHALAVKEYVRLILNADLGILTSTNKLELLQAKRSDRSPGFYFTLQNGHAAAVKNYVEIILNADASILTPANKLELLQAISSDGIPGFQIALQEGHAAAVREYVTLILNATNVLTAANKLELLQAKNSDGHSGFFFTLRYGHAAAVKEFVTLILNADANILTSANKFELLQAKDKDGDPGFNITLLLGYAAAVKEFVTLIINADANILTSANKLELLQAKSSNRNPGFELALINGYAPAVKEYASLILNADASILTVADKLELLQIKDGGEYYSGFCGALANGHAAVVKEFGTMILCADVNILTPANKLKLLQASNGQSSGFCEALGKGHAAVVKEYVNLVLNADASILTPANKLELLQAKDSDGYPGFYMALQEGHAAAVKEYVTLVLNADASILTAANKLKLLQARTSDEYPGFLSALHNGHVAAVKEYVCLILNADSSILTAVNKLELLQARTSDGTLGWILLLNKNMIELFKEFMGLVLTADNSVFSSESKLAFLLGSTSSVPVFYSIMLDNNLEGFIEFIQVILSAENLHAQQKITILSGVTADGLSILEIVNKLPSSSSKLEIFTKLVSGANSLSSSEKALLLNPSTNRSILPSEKDISARIGYALRHNDEQQISSLIKQIVTDRQFIRGGNNLKATLQALNANETPGLHIACELGNASVVKLFIELILSLDAQLLDNVELFELLMAKNKDGMPGLHKALIIGHVSIVTLFIQLILSTHKLSLSQKVELLKAKSADGAPGFQLALHNCKADIVKKFTELILSASLDVLSFDYKSELLLINGIYKYHSFHNLIENGGVAALQEYTKAIFAVVDTSTISLELRFKLLSAKDKNGSQYLHAALQYNSACSLVELYFTLVLEDKSLSLASKLELLFSLDNGSDSGLYWSFMPDKDNLETFRKFLELILATDKLTNTSKFDLLLAKNGKGNPGLAEAKQEIAGDSSQEWLAKKIEIFTQLISKTDLLSSVQKQQLLG